MRLPLNAYSGFLESDKSEIIINRNIIISEKIKLVLDRAFNYKKIKIPPEKKF